MNEVRIVKVFKRRVWSEKDFFGTVHIKVQHEGDPKPFTLVQIHYDHRYTSNGHQHYLTQAILGLLGADGKPSDAADR